MNMKSLTAQDKREFVDNTIMIPYNPLSQFLDDEIDLIARCGIESLITCGCNVDKIYDFMFHIQSYKDKPFYDKEFRDKILNNVSKKYELDGNGNIWIRLNFFKNVNETSPLQYQINKNIKNLSLGDFFIRNCIKNNYFTEIIMRGYQKSKVRIKRKGGGKNKGNQKPEWDEDSWYQIKISLINHGYTFEADLPESWGRSTNSVLNWFLHYWEHKFVPRLMKMNATLENHFKNRIIRWAAKNKVFLTNY